MPLRYEVKDHIAVFTLDNPPVNVWTPALHKEFHDRLVEFLADDDVHVGILTAAGDRAFSAGDDIKSPRPDWSEAELARRHLNGMRKDTAIGYPGWEAEIALLPRTKPMIGAVNGVAIGQGFIYLALLTDIRIASETARFGMVEIAHGMGGAAGALQLAHAMAEVDAMYLALTGELIDARRAHEIRLVNEVVPPERLMVRALEIAARIASHPRLAVRVEMEALQATRTMSREQAIRYSTHMFRILRTTINNPLPLGGQA
ncbi:MAG: enoyl-CoA hydratase/isomerase family protein [Phenylobacterium sp.]|nr:enoyl-CoA hydratase/isomerase family protein [Phenylobacterium sp.]